MKLRHFTMAIAAVWLVYRTYNGAGNNTTLLETLDVTINKTGAAILKTPASAMTVSAEGLQRIADREGFSANRYPDADGFSIGFGHFIKMGETFKEPIARSQGLQMLDTDAHSAADAVRAYVRVPITQNMFDSIVSLVYNIGAGQFKTSTTLRRLNDGDYDGAAEAMKLFNKSRQNGILAINDSLIARRESEIKQFLA